MRPVKKDKPVIEKQLEIIMIFHSRGITLRCQAGVKSVESETVDLTKNQIIYYSIVINNDELMPYTPA
jgi:hypothetical protein